VAIQRRYGSSSNRSRAREEIELRGDEPDTTGEPDVVLDVPQLKVDEIGLEVDNLRARIALQVRLADLLQLGVGADVVVDRVALEIKGVEAQAMLKARLENVQAILDRAFTTIDNNPEILKELAGTLEDTAGEVGDTAGQALGPDGALTETVEQAGETGHRGLFAATGGGPEEAGAEKAEDKESGGGRGRSSSSSEGRPVSRPSRQARSDRE
jgi:hypothetical protein